MLVDWIDNRKYTVTLRDWVHSLACLNTGEQKGFVLPSDPTFREVGADGMQTSCI